MHACCMCIPACVCLCVVGGGQWVLEDVWMCLCMGNVEGGYGVWKGVGRGVGTGVCGYGWAGERASVGNCGVSLCRHTERAGLSKWAKLYIYALLINSPSLETYKFIFHSFTHSFSHHRF